MSVLGRGSVFAVALAAVLGMGVVAVAQQPAAEVIDTPRSNLYKKIEQYGISQEVDG